MIIGLSWAKMLPLYNTGAHWKMAVKSPCGLPPSDTVIDFFLNQVVMKQVINHKSMAKLHGCCLETRVPSLVYEFLPNGTLSDQIDGGD